MNIIREHFFVIIIIGLFITFSLIGYLVELIKNNKVNQKEVKEVIISDLNEVEDINDKEESKTEKNLNIDKADELLESYNNENNI